MREDFLYDLAVISTIARYRTPSVYIPTASQDFPDHALPIKMYQLFMRTRCYLHVYELWCSTGADVFIFFWVEYVDRTTTRPYDFESMTGLAIGGVAPQSGGYACILLGFYVDAFARFSSDSGIRRRRRVRRL